MSVQVRTCIACICMSAWKKDDAQWHSATLFTGEDGKGQINSYTCVRTCSTPSHYMQSRCPCKSSLTPTSESPVSSPLAGYLGRHGQLHSAVVWWSSSTCWSCGTCDMYMKGAHVSCSIGTAQGLAFREYSTGCSSRCMYQCTVLM